MTLSVRPIETHELDTWDDFVEMSSNGALFHTSVWKHVIDNAYDGAKLLILGCFDDRALVGGATVLDRATYGQRTAVTPLLTPYTGFVLPAGAGEKMSDQVSRECAILKELSKWLGENFNYQKIVNSPHFEDPRPLQEAGYRLTPRFTYHLNLKLPIDELWERLDGSVRRQVRKAERATLDISDYFEPAEAYELYAATFTRRDERCPVSRQLFDEVVGSEHLRPYRQIFCAHSNGKLISYVVLLKYRRTVFYELASTDAESLSTGVSSYLIWEILREFACKEWNILDFVGANIPSISRFKEGFNPKLVLHFQAENFGKSYLKWGKALLEMIRNS